MGKVGQWTRSEDEVIHKNIHLSNAQIAELLPFRTKDAVADRVRKLGLTRTFTKDESAILRQVWGQPRTEIEKALPRWKWQNISKRANNMGLPSLAEVRDSVNLYTIVRAMGYGDAMAKSWVAAGLIVTQDKGSTFVNNSIFVKREDFWKFVRKNPKLIDFARLPEALFEIPVDILRLKNNQKPWPRKKNMKEAQREMLAWEFYNGNLSTSDLAVKYDCTEDHVRAVASLYKSHEWPTKRKKPSVVTSEMLDILYEMRFIEGKTVLECVLLLEVSEASVRRGIEKIMNEVDTTIRL